MTAPKGTAITVYRSQALDMLSDDGNVARTGRLRPGRDIDLVVRNHRLLPDTNAQVMGDRAAGFYDPVFRAFPDNEVDVEAAHALRLNPFSFGQLRLRFEAIGGGEFALRWDIAAQDAERACRDWQAKVVRFVGKGRLNLQGAMQALVYVARYAAILEPNTATRLRDAFLKAQRDYSLDSGELLDFGSALHTLDAIQRRFWKALRSAPEPGIVVRLLEELGVLDAPFYSQVSYNTGKRERTMGPNARGLIAAGGLPDPHAASRRD